MPAQLPRWMRKTAETAPPIQDGSLPAQFSDMEKGVCAVCGHPMYYIKGRSNMCENCMYPKPKVTNIKGQMKAKNKSKGQGKFFMRGDIVVRRE